MILQALGCNLREALQRENDGRREDREFYQDKGEGRDAYQLGIAKNGPKECLWEYFRARTSNS